jgi:hypothetical protein
VILDPVPEALETQLASVIHPRLATSPKIGEVAWKAVEASFVQATQRPGRRFSAVQAKIVARCWSLYAAPAM